MKCSEVHNSGVLRLQYGGLVIVSPYSLSSAIICSQHCYHGSEKKIERERERKKSLTGLWFRENTVQATEPTQTFIFRAAVSLQCSSAHNRFCVAAEPQSRRGSRDKALLWYSRCLHCCVHCLCLSKRSGIYQVWHVMYDIWCERETNRESKVLSWQLRTTGHINVPF